MHLPSRANVLAAGLALIFAPLIAIGLKVAVFPGWMMVIIVISGIPLVLGYVLQIVISAIAMLRARGVCNTVPGARRSVIAAWLTSAGVILTVFFLVDGGDGGDFGSAFTALVGMSSTSAGEQLSMTLIYLPAALWLGGWVWLVAEWIVLTVRARRATQS